MSSEATASSVPDLSSVQSREPLTVDAKPVHSLIYHSWLPSSQRNLYAYRLHRITPSAETVPTP